MRTLLVGIKAEAPMSHLEPVSLLHFEQLLPRINVVVVFE